MRSPFYFIVTPLNEKRYNNTIDYEGVNFISNTSQENFKSTNRMGVVVSTPVNYTGDIVKGDILVVHHNVFKIYYDMRGRQKSGRSFLKDNTFLVDETQFYAYNHNGEWRCHSNNCFVKPIDKKEYFIEKPGTEEALVGRMRYNNKELDKLGVHNGALICFEPESEYEFQIDGEKLYRMYTRNITMTL
jgi:G:T-mismatch repair DNA endonuclease (very short patch repair protein)